MARSVVAEMREAAERLLPAQFRAVVRRIEQPFLQPIYDLESTGVAFGRAALIGDAAFVVRPHVGAGIVKAAQDAAALAAALEEHTEVAAGLRAFEAQRIGEGRKFVAQARRLGSHLKYRFDTEAERATAAYHADPERMLAETALLDFLREPGHDAATSWSACQPRQRARCVPSFDRLRTRLADANRAVSGRAT